MPSFPLTFPTNVYPDTVRVRRLTAAGVAESPFTFEQQVYQFPGARWEIDVTIQPMSKVEAASWTQFFYDIKGRVGTFNFNLTPHCPGLSPDPGVVVFRLVNANPAWDSKLATQFGFAFSATQAL